MYNPFCGDVVHRLPKNFFKCNTLKVIITLTKLKSIHIAHQLAKNSNFTLCIKKYKNRDTKIDWKCNNCNTLYSKTLATVKLNGISCINCNSRTAWNKGIKGVSSETSIKMSQAKQGKIPWNKNKNIKEFTKIKLSCINTGISTDDFDGFKTPKNRRERAQFNGSLIRKKCFEQADYTCNFCGFRGITLHAHHLYNWNHYKELRYDLNNLVVLCKGCHKAFHKKYGNGKTEENTPEQYQEFKNTSSIGKNKVIILAGAPGSGKSWISKQLVGYEYYSMDMNKEYIGYILASLHDKPIVIDPTAAVITYFNRLKLLGYEVELVVIIEPIQIVTDRLNKRKGTMTDSVMRRIKRMKTLSNIANFSGTAEDVLYYLNKKAPNC